jgi:uncharacterized membrane protein YbhN (UPF0104 family)
MWTQAIRRLQPIFFLLALLFVLFLLRSQWAELRAYDWQLDWRWLAFSALLLLTSWLMEIGIWRHLLHLVGGDLSYAPALRIWFLSAIMRYIPGNVWQPLSMTVLCRRHGIRPEATLTGVVLYQAIILLAVVPMAGLYMIGTGSLGLFSEFLRSATWWLLGLALLPVIAFVVRPQWLMQGINWTLTKLGREILPVELTSVRLLALLLVASINWLFWGASFAALTFGLSSYGTAEIVRLTPHLVLAYPIAYAIGFLSFITPSGFGVREGAFFLLLAPVMEGGVVTVAALAMRVWTTAGELLMAGGSALWARHVHAPEAQVSAPPAEPVDVGVTSTDGASAGSGYGSVDFRGGT